MRVVEVVKSCPNARDAPLTSMDCRVVGEHAPEPVALILREINFEINSPPAQPYIYKYDIAFSNRAEDLFSIADLTSVS